MRSDFVCARFDVVFSLLLLPPSLILSLVLLESSYLFRSAHVRKSDLARVKLLVSNKRPLASVADSCTRTIAVFTCGISKHSI